MTTEPLTEAQIEEGMERYNAMLAFQGTGEDKPRYVWERFCIVFGERMLDACERLIVLEDALQNAQEIIIKQGEVMIQSYYKPTPEVSDYILQRLDIIKAATGADKLKEGKK